MVVLSQIYSENKEQKDLANLQFWKKKRWFKSVAKEGNIAKRDYHH
jgi:hypothetical protein